MDFLAARLFLDHSCCSNTVFVTLLRTAVDRAISETHKLLRSGGFPTSLKLLFFRWLIQCCFYVYTRNHEAF